MPDVTIRAWTPDVPVAGITTLLHSAYAPLAAMGFRYLATHQDDRMTFQRLSSGWSYLAFLSDTLVGTITLRRADRANICAWYREPTVFSFGQFAVLPGHQRQGIGSKLLAHVECKADHEGAYELALDTAEGAAHLIRWYQGRGYRQVEMVSWHDTNYRSVVLSKTLPYHPSS
jgi:GNAT superfamily N-acetyltransferase